MPHGHHIYTKAYEMTKATTCAYPRSDHDFPHCKFVLRFCTNFPCINILDQETDNRNSGTTPSIWFHICHIIASWNAHSIIPMKDNKICCKCKQESSSDESTKIYTRKYIVMIKT